MVVGLIRIPPKSMVVDMKLYREIKSLHLFRILKVKL